MADLRALALTAAAVVALSSAASAADLLPPPPAFEPPPPISAPEMGGWYIRGDVGVAVNNIAGAETNPSGISTLNAGWTGTEDWYNNALSHSMLFGVGVGYQVNSWFRADVTAELRGGASFSGLQVINVNGDGGDGTGAGRQVADFYKGNVSSALAMVNAYANLGTWYGLSPYVGAGVGVAFNHFSGGIDQGQITGPTAAGNPTSPSGGVFGANTTTNLAWALMAGFDFQVNQNLTLELGYRYIDYGKFKSGGSSCLSGNGSNGSFNVGSCGGQAFRVASKELTSNDFRLGLRYYFDRPAPPPPMEAPIVRKY